MIALDYYQDGEIINSITTYTQDFPLPDSKDENGNTRFEVKYSGYLGGGKPLKGALG